MADLSKSADALIEEVTEAVRKEMLDAMQPILRRMADAATELEGVLGGKRGRRRGRPPGRPAGRGRLGAGKKRSPRGALKAAVGKAMTQAAGPMKLSQIRDQVMKKALFRNRDPKTLYTMIVFVVKKMPNVKKTANGLYAISAASPKKRTKRRARKKKA